MSYINYAIRFMQEGGTYMFIILAVFLLGLAIAVERWLFLQKAKLGNRKTWDDVFPLIRKGDFAAAMKAAGAATTSVGNMISFGLSSMVTAQGQHDRRLLPAVGLANHPGRETGLRSRRLAIPDGSIRAAACPESQRSGLPCQDQSA